jgi:hypothetical protein
MPQFRTEIPNDPENRIVVYGFDRILQYYFVSTETPDFEIEHLVGLLSSTYGSAWNTLECLARLGVRIPKDHQTQLVLDLPLESSDGEPLPIEIGCEEEEEVQ